MGPKVVVADPASQRWIDAGIFEADTEFTPERLELLRWYERIGVRPEDFPGTDPDDLGSRDHS